MLKCFEDTLPPEMAEMQKQCSRLFHAVCIVAPEERCVVEMLHLHFEAVITVELFHWPHYTGCSESANDPQAPAHNLEGRGRLEEGNAAVAVCTS